MRDGVAKDTPYNIDLAAKRHLLRNALKRLGAGVVGLGLVSVGVQSGARVPS